MDIVLKIGAVLAGGVVGGWVGFWGGMLVCPQGSMSTDAIVWAICGAAGGAAVGASAAVATVG